MNERIIAHSPDNPNDCILEHYKKCSKWLTCSEHDYSLVISKQKTYCVIACLGYPKCSRTITIFKERDF